MRVVVCGNGMLGETIASCLKEAGNDVTPDVTEGPADIVWIAHDTPLGADGADVAWVFAQADKTLAHCPAGQIVFVSSQLPIGSIAKLDKKYPHLNFVCIPENLRTGKAVEGFKNPGSVVVGTPDRTGIRSTVEEIFRPFTMSFLWVSVESAEFIKHARNAYLAACITFANELGDIAIKHGANPAAVELGLKADPRVSSTAPLRYGLGSIGRHLSRDVAYLLALEPSAHLMHGVRESAAAWEAKHG